MKKYYLAYGSNLNQEEMKTRCPFATPIGKSFIKNYRLVFKGIKNFGYLTIEPCDGNIVPVGIYEITPIDEKNLDYYEGVPTLYSKKTLQIKLNSETIDAIVYIMNPEYTYNTPTDSYVKRCINGYRDFNLNPEYLTQAIKTTKENMSKTVIK